MKNILFISIILSVLGTSGCTGVNSEFSCNATASDTCAPIEKINDHANHGLYGSYRNNTETKKSSYKEKVENTKKVWIAATIDDNGVYHQGKFMSLNAE